MASRDPFLYRFAQNYRKLTKRQIYSPHHKVACLRKEKDPKPGNPEVGLRCVLKSIKQPKRSENPISTEEISTKAYTQQIQQLIAQNQATAQVVAAAARGAAALAPVAANQPYLRHREHDIPKDK
ncbi:hypothetical protein OUZ56_005511 [Daphnia magna]|uniref:Uncharacterized protein n=1 Tax=Daphnia magna TaxID=35525 RepID=A0ABQ9YT02_9CRUS|nr:hypothetical protein OUZ56_005511 [Daphnia magna]